MSDTPTTPTVVIEPWHRALLDALFGIVAALPDGALDSIQADLAERRALIQARKANAALSAPLPPPRRRRRAV